MGSASSGLLPVLATAHDASAIGTRAGVSIVLTLGLVALWWLRSTAQPARTEGWRLLEVSALVMVVAAAAEATFGFDAYPTVACAGASLIVGLVGITRRLHEHVAGVTFDALVESTIVSLVGGAVLWMLVVQPRLTDGNNVAMHALFAAGVVVASVLALSIAWLAAIEPMPRVVAIAGGVFALSYLAAWGRWLALEVDVHVPDGVGAWPAAVALVAAMVAGTVMVPAPPLQPDDITPVFRRRIVVVAAGAGPILTAVALADRRRTSWLGVLIAAVVLAVLEVIYLLRLFERRGQLERLAQRDDLTGLANRRLFNRRLREAHALARVSDVSLSVVLIDLDRFKVVNDALGHAAGDDLLVGASRRISEAVGDANVVARLGGDEFTVLAVGASREAVRAMAQGIVHAFVEPFGVLDHEVYITPSIGIAHYPEDGDTPGELLRSADVAMYRAKERGRNMVHEAAGCVHRSVDGLSLETDLRRAVERNELVVHYQPRIDLLSGSIVGAEALVRWDHPGRGLLPPDSFIPLAEEAGLVGEIGEWVLAAACRQGARWARRNDGAFTMAVNVSPRQFENDRLPSVVAAALRASRLDPTCLELELTESLALQDPDHVAAILTDLRAIGVRCSIDDFGTGYSSLHYIDRFPITTIKIDRSFVDPVSHERPGSAIVSAVIALARGLGIEVVAEGVETRYQAEFLIGEGCDQAQGFYYGHPLPADEFERVLDAALAPFDEAARIAPIARAGGATPSDDTAPVA